MRIDLNDIFSSINSFNCFIIAQYFSNINSFNGFIIALINHIGGLGLWKRSALSECFYNAAKIEFLCLRQHFASLFTFITCLFIEHNVNKAASL